MRLLFPCLLHTVLLAIYLPNIFASSDLATVPGQELIRREFTGSYYNLELELYVPRSSSNDVKNADARKLCLTITELDDKLCFSHLSHAGSWSLEKSVTLGQMWFNSEKYRRQVFDQLGQTLASTAQTPWEHIDAAMRSLANSWHVFVNEDQVLQTFKTTPLMAEPRTGYQRSNL
ncbi:hypothetical protein FB446DRAFT_382769 [Lentinula raphanica]|nr:hypothetical protein FB446DRAFT_382769 [Lentinula raphanica]